jgi:hypothetical protein
VADQKRREHCKRTNDVHNVGSDPTKGKNTPEAPKQQAYRLMASVCWFRVRKLASKRMSEVWICKMWIYSFIMEHQIPKRCEFKKK